MNLTVITTSWAATQGVLMLGDKRFECTLGRGGLIMPGDKKEGDGKTPIGIFPLRELIYRADRVDAPATGLPLEELTRNTGWCEDPAHADYNKKITMPHPAATDHMTRADHLYDYVVVIGYNDDPVVPGKGSAIFMHLAQPDFKPTAGCVGLRKADMLEVLKDIDASSLIDIRMPA